MSGEDDPAARNRRLLRRYLEDVWNEGDIEVIDEIFGDIDGMRRKWGDDIDDRAELKSYLGGLVEKYENDALTVRTLLADEQEVMGFWEMEMQLVDDHLGIKPPVGRPPGVASPTAGSRTAVSLASSTSATAAN